MTVRNQIYKCELCGNIVAMLTAGEGQMVCCDKPMTLLDEKTADSTTEKHVPVISRIDGGYKVVVGSTIHPMTEEHYIEWIELLCDGKSYRQFLKPGDQPEATFMIEGSDVTAREHCNVHGLWKS